MIDSHALVGSCAQVDRRVHVSAGAQIGGVLEPIGALPVIVEDDVPVIDKYRDDQTDARTALEQWLR